MGTSARLHHERLDADGARAGRAHAVRARHDLRLQARVLQRFHQEDPASEAQILHQQMRLKDQTSAWNDWVGDLDNCCAESWDTAPYVVMPLSQV